MTSGYGHVAVVAADPRPRHGRRPWRPRPSRSWARCRSPKAGVGSAMNDTTRQIGGALGVAILGSIFASVLRGAHRRRRCAVCPVIGRGCGHDLGGSGAGDRRADRRRARSRHHHGREGARSSMRWTAGLFVGAGIALLGALVALIWLPNRAAEAAAIELHVRRHDGELATVAERVGVSMPEAPATRAPGRPRDPQADRAILRRRSSCSRRTASVACRSRPSQLAPVSERRPSTGVGRRRSRSWSTRSPT